MARKKWYLILDTETATLPFANEMCSTPQEKQKIAIAKPLVYDIGWVIMDRQGNIAKKVNYLVQETFFVPNIFNTAYYRDKRPLYIEKLENGEISAKCWNDIIIELIADLETVDISCAYNATFDFKKAIPFTERYIEKLYSADYNKWECCQRYGCQKILNNSSGGHNKDFLKPFLELKGKKYPIADLWTIACDRLINIDRYRNYCLDNMLITASKIYFKTSAETSYQYLANKYNFIESHTALNDSEIEAQILAKALKKGKVEPILKAFPFKELGTTYDYAKEKRQKSLKPLLEQLTEYLSTLSESPYKARIKNILAELKEIC